LDFRVLDLGEVVEKKPNGIHFSMVVVQAVIRLK